MNQALARFIYAHESQFLYRDTIPCLSFHTITGAIAGTIFSMHPFGTPSGVPEICKSVLADLRTITQMKITKNTPLKSNAEFVIDLQYKKIGDGFEYLSMILVDDLLYVLDGLLKKIPEFQRLNLSRNEIAAGITDCDDPRRSGTISFVSRDSTVILDDDFIDLDACIRNIYHEILLKSLDDLTTSIRNMVYFDRGQASDIPSDEESEEKDTVIQTIPCIGFYKIAGAIAKNCYELHPFHSPEAVDRIICDTLAELRETAQRPDSPIKYSRVLSSRNGDAFEYLVDVPPADLYLELNRILQSLPEFRRLNLSLAEIRAGITDCDDPARGTNTNYCGPNGDRFVDLDACSRNIYLSLLEGALEDEICEIRNTRFNQFPWLTPSKRDSNPEVTEEKEEKEEKKAAPTVIAHSNKNIININVFDAAIHGYFYIHARHLWNRIPDREFSSHVSAICSDYRKALSDIHQDSYIEFGTIDDLRKIMDRLGELHDFKVLVEEDRGRIKFSTDLELSAARHIDAIWRIVVLLNHPELPFICLSNGTKAMERNEKEEKASEPDRYSASISDIKSAIMHELRANLLYLNTDLYVDLNTIVNAFVHMVVEVHRVVSAKSSWTIKRRMVYFTDKTAVRDFFLFLMQIPDFMAIDDPTDGKRFRPLAMIDNLTNALILGHLTDSVVI